MKADLTDMNVAINAPPGKPEFGEPVPLHANGFVIGHVTIVKRGHIHVVIDRQVEFDVISTS